MSLMAMPLQGTATVMHMDVPQLTGFAMGNGMADTDICDDSCGRTKYVTIFV